MSSNIATIAAESFGWTELHDGQAEAVEALLNGRDALVVMPTGYGKSAIYQLAGAARRGTCLVISPLIALQVDQVRSINDSPGALRAVMVNSSQSEAENEAAWAAVLDGTDYLFLSPEQLADESVLRKVQSAGVSLLVVDEAHCVSSWGSDFRPDYLRLGDTAVSLGRPPILALTATGAPPVRAEISGVLRLEDPFVLAKGFDRPNIRLDVARHSDHAAQLRAVIAQIRDLDGTGLVYAGTRRSAEDLAAALRDAGLDAEAYHAGLRAAERRRVHERFADADDRLVVVATSAFGMGIDRADVRFVVHAAIPESIEEYYQEIGRAGRDGEPAIAMLHYREQDLSVGSFFQSASVDAASVRSLLVALRKAGGESRRADLAKALGMPTRRVTKLGNQLEEVGAARLEGPLIRLVDDAGNRKIVSALKERAKQRERIGRSRLAMMRTYAETRECRRGFLLGYFGDELTAACGGCDICDTSVEAVEPAAGHDAQYIVGAAIEHSQWGPGTVMSVDGDKLTAYFDAEGYRQLSIPVLQDRHLITVVEPAPDGLHTLRSVESMQAAR